LAAGVLGGIDALAAVQFKRIHLTDTDAWIGRLTPDHLLTLSQHDGGCIASIEVGGDRPARASRSRSSGRRVG